MRVVICDNDCEDQSVVSTENTEHEIQTIRSEIETTQINCYHGLA